MLEASLLAGFSLVLQVTSLPLGVVKDRHERMAGGIAVVVQYAGAMGGQGGRHVAGADQDSQACDIGMSSRPISDKDVLAYPSLVNLGGRDTEHVLALDAIAIIVNPANPVSRLTVGQVRGIYSGEIKN